MARYIIRNDERALWSAIIEPRALGMGKYGRWFLKTLCFLGLGALAVAAAAFRIWLILAISLVILSLLFVGPRADYWLLRRRLRRSPHYNHDTTIDLSDDGLIWQWTGNRFETRWDQVPRAVRKAGGFLLFVGDANPRWLPDSALVDGSAAQVEALLRQKVGDFAAIP